MKTLLFIIVTTFPVLFFAQSNELKLFSISGQYNGNLWLPLDNASKTYKENGGKINVLTFKASLAVTLFRDRNYPIRIGTSYMKINHTVVDRIKSVTYDDYYTGIKTHTFTDPMDLRSRSHNIGIFIEPMWKLVHAKKSSGLVGLNMSVYFLEFYHSKYFTNDYNYEDDFLENIQPLVQGNKQKLGVSSSSLELFYLHNFNLKPNFSLGVRASLGGNMYSNWNQFKRYIWAGVGVEMSFVGNKKVEE